MPIITKEPGEDLFQSGAEMLVNPTNTVGVMGRGLAAAFKRRWPEMFAEYTRRCAQGLVTTEAVDLHVVVDPAGRPLLVANLSTKRHWREESRIEWVDAGLRSLARVVRKRGVRSVAVPAVGCGLGGLDWALAPVVDDGVVVHVYPPI